MHMSFSSKIKRKNREKPASRSAKMHFATETRLADAVRLSRFRRARATRYLREEGAEPLGHRRVREGGISKPRI
jgi:hypothetical protein